MAAADKCFIRLVVYHTIHYLDLLFSALPEEEVWSSSRRSTIAPSTHGGGQNFRGRQWFTSVNDHHIATLQFHNADARGRYN